MSDFKSGIAHLAGEMITFQNESRQRCVWCGVLLDSHDYTREAVMIPKGQSLEVTAHQHRQIHWEGWVERDGNMMFQVEVDPADPKAPENSCMALGLGS